MRDSASLPPSGFTEPRLTLVSTNVAHQNSPPVYSAEDVRAQLETEISGVCLVWLRFYAVCVVETHNCLFCMARFLLSRSGSLYRS